MKLLLYVYAATLPLRMELYQVGTAGVRLPDIASLAVALGGLTCGRLRWKRTFFAALLVFAVTVVISSGVSMLRLGFHSEGLLELLRLVLSVVPAVTMTGLLNSISQHFVTRLAASWVAASSIACLISLVKVLVTVGFPGYMDLVFGGTTEFYQAKFLSSPLFDDPNNFASYLLLSLFISVGLRGVVATRQIKFALSVVIVLHAIALLLTLSRSAVVGLAVGLLYALWSSGAIGRLFSVAIGAIAALVGGPWIASLLASDFSARSRLDLWAMAVGIAMDNPILGVGLGATSLVYDSYRGSFSVYNPYAHNLMLKVLSELGVAGLASTLCVLLAFTWHRDGARLVGGWATFRRMLLAGLLAFATQGLAVEYFSAKHLWLYLALIYVQARTAQRQG